MIAGRGTAGDDFSRGTGFIIRRAAVGCEESTGGAGRAADGATKVGAGVTAAIGGLEAADAMVAAGAANIGCTGVARAVGGAGALAAAAAAAGDAAAARLPRRARAIFKRAAAFQFGHAESRSAGACSGVANWRARRKPWINSDTASAQVSRA
jgi:hypothetical protein